MLDFLFTTNSSVQVREKKTFLKNLKDFQEIEKDFFSYYGIETPNPTPKNNLRLLKEVIPFALKELPTVLVTGTNGKGQTCLEMALWCEENKRPYLLFTSPHLVSLQERFRVLGRWISPEEFKQSWQQAKEIEEKYNINFSFYESVFLIFCLWGNSLNPSSETLLIAEIGVGGRLDCCNTLEPKVSVITSIGRDHQELLGNSYLSILKEKWGIARPSIPIITGFTLKYLLKFAKQLSVKNQNLWENVGENIETKKEEALTFDSHNSLMAQRALQVLYPNIIVRLRDSHARFFKLRYKGHSLLLSGAHNPAGIKSLIQYMKAKNPSLPIKAILLAFSKRKKEDCLAMIKSLFEGFSEASIFLACFSHTKSLSFEGLEEISRSLVYPKTKKNIHWVGLDQFLLEQKTLELQDSYLLICGSYYFLGEIFKEILTREEETL